MKLNNKVLTYLICIAILANATGLLFPALRSTYAPYYASIAKHIVVSGNWVNLVLAGHDWLDKPHFPFWVTAVSYEIFGINSFAYILPGFLFNLIGLYFTYKLARVWYSREISLISVLFTVTSLHIMLSAIDVRAEAYLLGEIIPACYFWLLYDKHSKIIYLLLGAFFTALALMTKGLFTLTTIISGVAVLWIYRGEWQNFIRPKWLIALLLSFIFIAPELLALYSQFDLHPEKVIYGHTHVSGIKWFFWGSQFGRFLETGPIHGGDSSLWHYLFFVHTFFWAYLPWWPIFFAAIWVAIKDLRCFIRSKSKSVTIKNNCDTSYNDDQTESSGGVELEKDSNPLEARIFLFASFFITFILFSVSTFQVDHYTNIVFPFASIICANYVVSKLDRLNIELKPKVFYMENTITVLLLILVLAIAPSVLSGIWLMLVIILDIISWIILIRCRHKSWFFQMIVYPVLAICVAFVFIMGVNGILYAQYDGGYQIANYLNQKSNIQVASYDIEDINQIDMLSLDFHSSNPYRIVNSLDEIRDMPKPIYLVVDMDDVSKVMGVLKQATIDRKFGACTIETFVAYMIDSKELAKKLHEYVVLKINN